MLMHDVSMAVRTVIVTEHLMNSVSPFVRGWFRRTRLKRVAKLFDWLLAALQADAGVIGHGIHEALGFVLSWRAPDPELVKAFAADAKGNVAHLMDIRAFLRLADAYGATSPGLDVIRATVC
jgi:hypothetical protein